jgi:signal transduction histidine kinase
VDGQVSQEITGYGTNINEKIQSFSDFIEILKMQREESEGMEMKFEYDFISKTVFAEGAAAVFVDEVKLTMIIEGKDLELFLRLSSVFEYQNSTWLAIHFHGSLARGIEGDRDTWTVNEWKHKNEKLERIILEKTNDLQQSLENLKATQTQLIQSEKMASLGELTAGIAHEIQNPLNFVNNFSEVSKDLIEEMIEEVSLGNLDEAKKISKDISENLDKINHHGQRASSIVQGMLSHSRTGKRQRDLTDINLLADEYLRLAYHGLRAKDKSFNADFKAELDKSIPKINVVAQDVGRVLLNLINNAFYAVSKKAQAGIEGYRPVVSVITKLNNKTVEIRVRDNGGGIPRELQDKIFQPFFTTKPTGEGTGLGLSLSYDIIMKGHDGHLEVESEEGQGTQFTIILPNK